MWTPWSSSFRALVTTIEATTTTIIAGIRGARCSSARISASEPTPTATLAPCASPRCLITPQICWKKLPWTPWIPSSFDSWPEMIVSAIPMMKPLSTGSEISVATKPSRNSPATKAARPVAIASAAVSAAAFVPPCVTNWAIAPADSAAVADIGPVTRCRELPKAAYRISAAGTAYRPTTGDAPASEPYASASGTSTAQTVNPAIASPRSHVLW